MPVRKRIEKPKIKEIDIDALIEKGANIKNDCHSDEKKWTKINLRISMDMLKNVDECVEKRVGITRTGWILEAIHEKHKKSKEI